MVWGLARKPVAVAVERFKGSQMYKQIYLADDAGLPEASVSDGDNVFCCMLVPGRSPQDRPTRRRAIRGLVADIAARDQTERRSVNKPKVSSGRHMVNKQA